MIDLVTIDPGETTGVAFFSEGDLIFSAAFETYDGGAMYDLAFILGYFKPKTIMMEDVALRGDKAQIKRVEFLEAFLYSFVPSDFTIERVQPSHWKQGMKTRRTKLSSAHQRDAIDMGRWWLERSGDGS